VLADPVSSSQRQRVVARPDARSGSISSDAPKRKQSEVTTDRHSSAENDELPPRGERAGDEEKSE